MCIRDRYRRVSKPEIDALVRKKIRSGFIVEIKEKYRDRLKQDGLTEYYDEYSALQGKLEDISFYYDRKITNKKDKTNGLLDKIKYKKI